MYIPESFEIKFAAFTVFSHIYIMYFNMYCIEYLYESVNDMPLATCSRQVWTRNSYSQVIKVPLIGYKITPIVRVLGKDERILYRYTPTIPSKSFQFEVIECLRKTMKRKTESNGLSVDLQIRRIVTEQKHTPDLFQPSYMPRPPQFPWASHHRNLLRSG
jgi:hypothetical protein